MTRFENRDFPIFQFDFSYILIIFYACQNAIIHDDGMGGMQCWEQAMKVRECFLSRLGTTPRQGTKGVTKIQDLKNRDFQISDFQIMDVVKKISIILAILVIITKDPRIHLQISTHLLSPDGDAFVLVPQSKEDAKEQSITDSIQHPINTH